MIELFAEILGVPNVTMFEGGWVQWQNDINNPIEYGIPAFARNQK